ncbi:MAG: hypothetical protein KDN22_21295 [Verrucomicrobiae bacterium]|nr:hypothetical protein [Verrucomicrobiae bacterium]
MDTSNDPPAAYEIEEKQYGFKDVWRRKKEWFWAGALLTFLTIVLVSAAMVYLLPREYTARVRLEVRRDSQTYEVFSENSAKDNRSFEDQATFMRNEVVKMSSKETLYRVVHEYQLYRKWDGAESPADAYEMLLERLEVKQLPGSSMVDITVRHTDPQEAADLANAVAQAYRNNRTEQETTLSNQALDTLNAQETLQEQKVEDARGRMIELMEKYNIVDLGTQSNTVLGSDTTETGTGNSVMEARAEALKAEARVIALRTEVETVMRLNGEIRLRWLQNQNRLSPSGADVVAELAKVKLKLAMITPPEGEEVPSQAQSQLGELRHQEAVLQKLVDREERDQSSLLQQELDIAENVLKSLEMIESEQRERMMDERKAYTQYGEARRAFEAQSIILHSMREALLKEKVDLSLPKQPIAVYEIAEANEQPVAKRMEGEVKTAAVTGALWAIPGGLVFMYLALAFSRPREFEYVYEYVEKNSVADAIEASSADQNSSPY